MGGVFVMKPENIKKTGYSYMNTLSHVIKCIALICAFFFIGVIARNDKVEAQSISFDDTYSAGGIWEKVSDSEYNQIKSLSSGLQWVAVYNIDGSCFACNGDLWNMWIRNSSGTDIYQWRINDAGKIYSATFDFGISASSTWSYNELNDSWLEIKVPQSYVTSEGKFTVVVSHGGFLGATLWMEYTIKINDKAPPNASLNLYGSHVNSTKDAQYTNTKSLTASISASDGGTISYCLNQSTSCSSSSTLWTTTKPTTYTLNSTTQGSRTVYLHVKDSVGNQTYYTDSIIYHFLQLLQVLFCDSLTIYSKKRLVATPYFSAKP